MQASQILAAVGYGGYINAWKLLPLLVALMIWARLMTWADKDSIEAHLPRQVLNSGFLGGLALAFILYLMLPGFVGLAAFVGIMAVEAAVYLIIRQQKVGLADLSKQFSEWVHSLTHKEKAVEAEEGEVLLISKKGTQFATPEAEDPERAGFSAAQSMLTDALRRGAERVEMRPTETTAAVKYWVDGVPIDGRSVPKEDAAAGVTLLKKLGGLDLNDRRKPQTGAMKATIDNKKHDLAVHTAGTTAGETISVEVNVKKRYDLAIDRLGFIDDQLNLLEETIGDGEGIVLLAAPKDHGLTTLLYAILKRHDAFLSHIQTIERNPPVDLEGITQNELPPGAPPAEEEKQVNWVASQEPDVLMVDRVDDPRSAMDLINFAAQGRRAYIGFRANSTFEALQMWRTLVGDDKAAMKSLKLVVAGRLLRKLCTACKMDYNPDPDTLRKLNMPPERVGKLFTARNQPLRDAKGREMVCEFCLDLRFKGRTGIYEMFKIDDDVKQVVLAGGSVNQLKMLFKKQRQRYLQEMALAAAVAGETSLQEVARVLRAGETAPTPSSRSSTTKRPAQSKEPKS